jgi:hypothetical protein
MWCKRLTGNGAVEKSGQTGWIALPLRVHDPRDWNEVQRLELRSSSARGFRPSRGGQIASVPASRTLRSRKRRRSFLASICRRSRLDRGRDGKNRRRSARSVDSRGVSPDGGERSSGRASEILEAPSDHERLVTAAGGPGTPKPAQPISNCFHAISAARARSKSVGGLPVAGGPDQGHSKLTRFCLK